MCLYHIWFKNIKMHAKHPICGNELKLQIERCLGVFSHSCYKKWKIVAQHTIWEKEAKFRKI